MESQTHSGARPGSHSCVGLWQEHVRINNCFLCVKSTFLLGGLNMKHEGGLNGVNTML